MSSIKNIWKRAHHWDAQFFYHLQRSRVDNSVDVEDHILKIKFFLSNLLDSHERHKSISLTLLLSPMEFARNLFYIICFFDLVFALNILHLLCTSSLINITTNKWLHWYVSFNFVLWSDLRFRNASTHRAFDTLYAVFLVWFWYGMVLLSER